MGFICPEYNKKLFIKYNEDIFVDGTFYIAPKFSISYAAGNIFPNKSPVSHLRIDESSINNRYLLFQNKVYVPPHLPIFNLENLT
ncbi:hypothetical protein H8356DRAFT_1418477 [Neocallimastix lanati (nom. inval.)]|nr:hypothetical protein H8356DRAFT_1418477 [Neocallimastix sp. JGI-2020a]